VIEHCNTSSNEVEGEGIGKRVAFLSDEETSTLAGLLLDACEAGGGRNWREPSMLSMLYGAVTRSAAWAAISSCPNHTKKFLDVIIAVARYGGLAASLKAMATLATWSRRGERSMGDTVEASVYVLDIASTAPAACRGPEMCAHEVPNTMVRHQLHLLTQLLGSNDNGATPTEGLVTCPSSTMVPPPHENLRIANLYPQVISILSKCLPHSDRDICEASVKVVGSCLLAHGHSIGAEGAIAGLHFLLCSACGGHPPWMIPTTAQAMAQACAGLGLSSFLVCMRAAMQRPLPCGPAPWAGWTESAVEAALRGVGDRRNNNMSVSKRAFKQLCGGKRKKASSGAPPTRAQHSTPSQLNE